MGLAQAAWPSSCMARCSADTLAAQAFDANQVFCCALTWLPHMAWPDLLCCHPRRSPSPTRPSATTLSRGSACAGPTAATAMTCAASSRGPRRRPQGPATSATILPSEPLCVAGSSAPALCVCVQGDGCMSQESLPAGWEAGAPVLQASGVLPSAGTSCLASPCVMLGGGQLPCMLLGC